MKRLIFLLIVGFASCYRTETEIPLVAIQIQDRNGVTETISSPERIANYNQIDFLSSQPYKKILRVYRKDGKSHSKITTYHPNGVIWQYLEAEEMRANGAYKEWHPNGQLKIEARVIGGVADVGQGAQKDWLFDGEAKVWDEQGHLLAQIPYRQGDLEGGSVYFYPSGQIEKTVPFRQNSIEGELVEYYSQGALKSRTWYRDGKRQGPSVGFFENGQVMWEETYADELVLKGVYYDPKGVLVSEVADGLGFRSIFENQSLSHLIQIRQGYPEGEVRQFSPGGEMQVLYHIKNGKKHGEEINYFLSSERQDGGSEPLPKLSLNWSQDKIHGPVKTWYSTGQIQSQREYSNNQTTGTSLSWYRDGSLMLLEEYEENRLTKGQYYKKNGRDPISSIVNGNGIATLYDDQGIFLRKITYAKGEALEPEN